MARSAFAFALVVFAAAGAPALSQTVSRTDPPTRTYATPAPAESPAPECRTEIDCAPDLAGAPPSRPSKTWSVRSSQFPPDAELQPYYPIAIIADVDADERDGRDGRHHRGKPNPRD